MPAAIIATMPANAPAANPPAATAVAPAPSKPGSALPVFAQMVAQKMAAPNSRQSCAPGAGKVPDGASSAVPANSLANSPQKKLAPTSTTPPASTPGSALPNQLNPVLGQILPQSIGIAMSNPRATVPASNPCSVWTITDGAGIATAPVSLSTPHAPNASVPNAPLGGLASDNGSPTPANQIASGAGNLPSASTTAISAPPIATSLQGE